MNYDELLSGMISVMSKDLSIPQPYRNSVVSDARRLQMEIRGARSMTNAQAPENGSQGSYVAQTGCTCGPGMKDGACPTHGDKA